MKSIGGEFELDPVALASSATLPLGLRADARQQWLRSGRGAIRYAAATSRPTGTWLLPSYLCESVKQPFDELGCPVQFYRINDDARIDVAHLQAQITRYQPVGLLFINYFGMPLLPDEQQAIDDARKYGCFIIEDATHGSVLEGDDAPAGRLGDAVVSSLRKYLPVPDGALLRIKNPSSLGSNASLAPDLAAEAFGRQRTLAKLLRWEFLHGAGGPPEAEGLFMTMFSQAEKLLDASGVPYPASPWSAPVLAAQDLTAARAQRRLNFAALAEAWQHSDLARWATPLYTTLPAGASPFAFPVLVSPPLRDDLRRALVREQLYCPVLWPLPEAIDTNEFASSYHLSARIMCLPLDQRYTSEDMQDVARRFGQTARQLGPL
ncbi:hypothetical protein GCM10022409_12000 [Hymenobacter glaciei]|uniref:DegT/DnrJ/EryC1/StrS aminotransferase n=1 Tax=Hymenobacter glaciei TaxID=877209 RepID=A0ABP7TPM3_9BACT